MSSISHAELMSSVTMTLRAADDLFARIEEGYKSSSSSNSSISFLSLSKEPEERHIKNKEYAYYSKLEHFDRLYAATQRRLKTEEPEPVSKNWELFQGVRHYRKARTVFDLHAAGEFRNPFLEDRYIPTAENVSLGSSSQRLDFVKHLESMALERIFNKAALEHFSVLDVESLLADPGFEMEDHDDLKSEPAFFVLRPHEWNVECGCVHCERTNHPLENFDVPHDLKWCSCLGCISQRKINERKAKERGEEELNKQTRGVWRNLLQRLKVWEGETKKKEQGSESKTIPNHEAVAPVRSAPPFERVSPMSAFAQRLRSSNEWEITQAS